MVVNSELVEFLREMYVFLFVVIYRLLRYLIFYFFIHIGDLDLTVN